MASIRKLVLAPIVVVLLAPSAGAGTIPAVGSRAEDVDLAALASPSGFGHAVPLKGSRPDWYTPEVHRQVKRGTAVAAPAQAPLPSTVGIRPGAWMIAPAGCTMNFIFQQGGSFAIGTAGHCVEQAGQAVTLLTLAPGTENPVLVNVGSVITFRNNGIGDDFALVSIRPELNSWVDPTIAVVGGPCGGYGGAGPETVWHYGHGLAIGTGGTPRAGVALTWRAAAYGWDGAAIFGDSGSPVRVTDLRAAGNLTHLVVDTNWLPSFIAGTRIGRIQQIAGAWNLADSTLCL
ncbi:MAG: hypothetical protein ACRDH1_06515 [Actinomycetota bacterium]